MRKCSEFKMNSMVFSTDLEIDERMEWGKVRSDPTIATHQPFLYLSTVSNEGWKPMMKVTGYMKRKDWKNLKLVDRYN